MLISLFSMNLFVCMLENLIMLVCGERQQDEANTATNTATNTDPIPNQAHPQM